MKPPKKGYRRIQILVTIDAPRPRVRRDNVAHLCRDIRNVFDWDDELKVRTKRLPPATTLDR